MDTSTQHIKQAAGEMTFNQWRDNLEGFCLKQKQILWQIWLTANGKSRINNGYKGPV